MKRWTALQRRPFKKPAPVARRHGWHVRPGGGKWDGTFHCDHCAWRKEPHEGFFRYVHPLAFGAVSVVTLEPACGPYQYKP